MIRVGEEKKIASMPIASASFPAPFESGLEFSVPARGVWTIVHVGMLVPEVHEIFVCAAGCLRGVVLSAAEMNMTDRFSTVAIEEHNVLDGDMEELLTEGVTDILNRLPALPKAVLVFSSCIHDFMGCDLEMCYNILRERFPGVDFTDCYMTPIMRKSGLTPDQIMRRQLYSLLRPVQKEEKNCAVVGNCFSMDESSDIVRVIRSAGWNLHQITECKNYEEYLKMAHCSICISTQDVAVEGGNVLAEKMDMKHLFLPAGFSTEKICANLSLLAESLGSSYDAIAAIEEEAEAEAERMLDEAYKIIGNTPVAIDYTFTPRPLELAKLLLTHGFNVKTIFADSFSGDEEEEFDWLRENHPDIEIYPTVHPTMRTYPCGSEEKILAFGQKAAYFTDSPYFVNLVEGGGLYGFDGIRRLAELMIESFNEPKDVEKEIRIKGWGCESCL